MVKKQKNRDESEAPLASGDDAELKEQIASLERMVEALKKEHQTALKERDAHLKNFASLTEEAVKSSPAYIALQTQMAWLQKVSHQGEQFFPSLPPLPHPP